MSSKVTYDTIRKTVANYLPHCRVWLFGSRAKGTEDIHSDYDLLVITPTMLTQQEKISLSTKLDKAIVSAIHAPIDLLLYSEAEVLEKQVLPGHIVQSAIREGMAL